MDGWMFVALLVAGFALYGALTCWWIVRDNRPPPRWPGDP